MPAVGCRRFPVTVVGDEVCTGKTVEGKVTEARVDAILGKKRRQACSVGAVAFGACELVGHGPGGGRPSDGAGTVPVRVIPSAPCRGVHRAPEPAAVAEVAAVVITGPFHDVAEGVVIVTLAALRTAYPWSVGDLKLHSHPVAVPGPREKVADKYRVLGPAQGRVAVGVLSRRGEAPEA